MLAFAHGKQAPADKMNSVIQLVAGAHSHLPRGTSSGRGQNCDGVSGLWHNSANMPEVISQVAWGGGKGT